MNDETAILDLAAFAATLPARLSKDERHIQLFVADLPNVAARLRVSDPGSLKDFATDSGALVVKWVEALGKVSFRNFQDPFKGVRGDTRAFARKWAMSPALIKELG